MRGCLTTPIRRAGLPPVNPKPPDDLPPREHFEVRLAVGERWALFAVLLILVGVVGLAKGLPGVVALFILCGSAAASTVSVRFIVPTFLRLYRLKHRRDRDRRN